MTEIAGGEGPHFGDIKSKEQGEQKVLFKCKSLNFNQQETTKSLHLHRAKQAAIRRKSYRPENKALGGPQEHQEFEPWDDDHPIVKLFSLPNLLDCSYDLWAYSTLFSGLTGECHWWVMRNEHGVPVELWVIPSHWMRLVTGRDGMPEAWAIQSPWGTLQYAPYDDVLSFYEHSPLNRYEGWSIPLMVSEWIDNYEASVRSRLAQNINGAIPAFHVALSDEYVDPDEAMLNRYYAKWFSRFMGPDNAGKPLITGPGVELKPLGLTPVDMAYVETENQYRDMILAAYRVPKGVVGLEPSSDVSAYAPQRQFVRFAINPYLGFFGQRVTHGLIRRTPYCEHGTMFWHDRVVDDPETTRADLTLQLANGLKSPNEGRADYGLEPWPYGGDNPLLNGQQVPWYTGEQPQEQQDVEQAMQRATQGKLEINESDDDSPLIVDKDEEESVGPILRWHRTYDGDLESAGSHRWKIERKKRKDGKTGYILYKDDQEIDAASSCGLLKELAEKEEGAVEKQALGGTTGSSGGYAVPVDYPKKRNFGQRYVPNSTATGHTGIDAGHIYPPEGVSIEDRIKLNDEVRDIMRRRGLILGKNMVIGNGRSH